MLVRGYGGCWQLDDGCDAAGPFSSGRLLAQCFRGFCCAGGPRGGLVPLMSEAADDDDGAERYDVGAEWRLVTESTL